MTTTVLVVDDEKDLVDLLAHHLKGAGFDVITAGSGRDAIEIAARTPPDLVLLDIMLPDVQGTDVMKRLRQDPATAEVPVIFLTAKGGEMDRVVGFELGADDYVVKPFSARELVLRVRALLRRSAGDEAESRKVLERDGIRIDPGRHEARIEGRELDLTPTEFRLLRFLMERPGRVLSRNRLLHHVWGAEVYVTDRTVDTHVKRLRSKLGDAAELIETVRGVGYRFQG